MKIPSPLQKTLLAALLLAGCCSAVAEPETALPQGARDSVDMQATPPVTPAGGTAAAAEPLAGPAATAPVVADDPATAVLPGENSGNPDATPGPFDAATETAAEGSSGAEDSGDPGEENAAEAASAAVPAIDPATLHGEWIVREQHPDAGEVVTRFSINPDSSFAGTMTVAGKVVWSYSGNWYLDGNLITWFYTQSTPPLMLVDETEVDEIIAIDGEKLVYRSGKRDVLETLYRASN